MKLRSYVDIFSLNIANGAFLKGWLFDGDVEMTWLANKNSWPFDFFYQIQSSSLDSFYTADLCDT